MWNGVGWEWEWGVAYAEDVYVNGEMYLPRCVARVVLCCRLELNTARGGKDRTASLVDHPRHARDNRSGIAYAEDIPVKMSCHKVWRV